MYSLIVTHWVLKMTNMSVSMTNDLLRISVAD